MTVTNEVIGHTQCPDCKAKVERRINKNRKVYWHCDGRADDPQCNAAFKHGAAMSRRLIAAAAKPQPSNDNEPQETIEHEEDNTASKRQSGNSGRAGIGCF
ncbi:zinc ribbon domain-containing protein [Paremcibacter congregatus]|uniref:zinc ribbon domain-containing protein n=1 Tax=Paremcibacter congregatus TaxID=2043170 RepID=UPI0010550FC9|nr:zinc ribbon domain-containing protein [Paremcibacter congregatus]QDE27266.1 hypothetical protein FIV45_08200 [Paremcibacter congregatus]QDE27289.1 hypothetical protein FIV45_08315 [Paremcibacter congregatus]